MKSLIALMFFAACGSSSSSNVDSNPGGGDGPHGDAVVVASSIMITGTATAPGIPSTTNVSGATIGAYRAADDSLVISTTTDASGKFTLVVPTNGTALDGYLKATLATYIDTYLYPPAPLTADYTGAAVEMVTSQTFMTLSTIAQGNQMDDKGTIALEIEDASAMTVSGATVSSNPASSAYRYDGTGISVPSSTATATQADGVAYMFNAPVGAITVSATKAGTTFKSNNVKSWAGALTTTLITP